MNDDYISRSAGIIALAHRKCGNDEYDIAVQDCIETLKHLPAADVKPVVRGKWQLLEGGAGRCPNCKSVLKDVWDYDRSDPFCRECGADMREGSKNDQELRQRACETVP